MMSFFKTLSFFSFTVSNLYLTFTLSCIHAAIFEIFNNCTYTVWAAAVPGGGRELLQGQSWVVNTDPNFADTGRIWARTNCNFDDSGIGKCDSGDCGGVLYCVSSKNVTPPFTLAEYAISGLRNVEGFEISLMNGFNVPMEFKEKSGECSTVIKCTGDINRWCPTELRDPGGCNHPCTVFNNDQFCCFHNRTCNPSVYSKYFKDLCPHVSTYPGDFTNTLTGCSYGTNYQVTFCPSST